MNDTETLKQELSTGIDYLIAGFLSKFGDGEASCMVVADILQQASDDWKDVAKAYNEQN